MLNPLMPNDPYRGRTAPLTSKRCILYIYSTNIGTEYFKHGIYSPFFSLQNAVCFIILTYLVPVLFTFYIQGVLKLKKKSGTKRLMLLYQILFSIKVTTCPPKTPVTFWTICISIIDTPPSFNSWPLKNGQLGFPKTSVPVHTAS